MSLRKLRGSGKVSCKNSAFARLTHEPRSLASAILCGQPGLLCAEQRPAARTADLGLTAVGRQHHPIHTSSKEAQEYFDQGITLPYGFNH
jgi:hypothetical protein